MPQQLDLLVAALAESRTSLTRLESQMLHDFQELFGGYTYELPPTIVHITPSPQRYPLPALHFGSFRLIYGHPMSNKHRWFYVDRICSYCGDSLGTNLLFDIVFPRSRPIADVEQLGQEYDLQQCWRWRCKRKAKKAAV